MSLQHCVTELIAQRNNLRSYSITLSNGSKF